VPSDSNASTDASSITSGSEPAATTPSPAVRKPLPAGYRQGVITAITVFIGFSLSFFRYWAFEAPGDWTPRSLGALLIMLVPICAQINALYRALRIEDDDERTYQITMKWFVWSIFGMLFALGLAAVVLSGAFG
jgi:hypothetical protein